MVFFEQQSTGPLSISLSLFPLCLALPLAVSFSFFSLHRFQEFRSCRWQRKSSSIDFAGHVCAWAWWYLNSRSRQKPGPLAACAFVPSTRTRDRHLAFNGDDRRFPLSPSGRVYLISNAVERPRVFTTLLHFIFIAFLSSTPFAFSSRNAPRETSFFARPIHDTCFRSTYMLLCTISFVPRSTLMAHQE